MLGQCYEQKHMWANKLNQLCWGEEKALMVFVVVPNLCFSKEK